MPTLCEAVQHGIARQAEDVVDAVLLAPRHGLGPAVVAVSPEGEPGARPVPADAAHQVLEEDAAKLLFLAIRNAGMRWKRPVDWTAAMGQFAILFEERFPASAR